MYKHTEKCINIHTISGFPVDLSENYDNFWLPPAKRLTMLIFQVRSGELYIQFNKLSDNSGSLKYLHIHATRTRVLYRKRKNRNIWSKTEQYLGSIPEPR